MFERFTRPAREVVSTARKAAGEGRPYGDRAIGTEHLLVGLVDGGIGGIAHDALRAAGVDTAVVTAGIARHPSTGQGLSAADADALRSVGIDLDAVLARVEESFGPGALDSAAREAGRGSRGRRRASRGLTPAARKSLELALREAIRLRHTYIGTEHLLLGILRGADGTGAAILTEAGVDLDVLRGDIERRLREAA
ncbi:MAG TPA: Clp protease N-terminal domain-containing protein [Micromonosporaceae bacterium]|nr:Clp protease N-terminal domain-containing protein [Micromonosporaceae bacterium]